MRTAAVVFDLGGVLLEFQGVASIVRMSNGRVDQGGFSRFWSESKWADQVYRGLCTPEEFSRGAVSELGLHITPEFFLREWGTWLRGWYPGAVELLRRARGNVRVACLSNTNELDVAAFRSRLGVPDEFDRCFFSNEIGFRKPSAETYAHVLEELDLPAPSVAFIDDSDACVAGAIAAGMRGYRCVGVAEANRTLRALGL